MSEPTVWTAPPVVPVRAPLLGDERGCLQGWLDCHRQTLLWKCSGLTADQLRTRALAPSELSLLGIVRHMVEVERWWFGINAAQIAGLDYEFCTEEDEEADWHGVDTADAAADLMMLRAETHASDRAVAALDLDHQVPGLEGGSTKNLRWIYVHMIEEYARHNGHADALRERIDGFTGDFPVTH
ncbi:MAG TPA: DinB family protein [Actinomycetales bacterium]|jgi:hypothetical protein